MRDISALKLARQTQSDEEIITVLEALEDDHKHRGDVAYMAGHSEGMVVAGRLFDVLTHMWRQEWVQQIALSGSDGRGWGDERDYPGAAWPGLIWYMAELQSRGVVRADIAPITRGPQRNSLQETEALLLQAGEERWGTIIVVSVDYHRVRQVLGMVKQMERLGRRKVYLPSIPFNWYARMMGSQNTRMSTGLEEAHDDWTNKIPTYQAKGDLATLAEFLDYIKWRDSK